MKGPEQQIDTAPNPKRQTEMAVQEMKQIRETLFDPHVISEKHDRGGRKTMASEITRGRQLSHSFPGNITGREEILKQIEQQRVLTLNALKAETLISLEQSTEHVLSRLKSLLGSRDKKADGTEGVVSSLVADIDSLSKQAEEVRMELGHLREAQVTIPDPKKLLESYYEKMETVPLANEEKRELLKPEVLAELSTEEYIALWRRLNPHFLSHVTRQGFRDHNATMYHSAGLQEFHNGFTSVLEDEKILRPPMAVRDGLRARDEMSVRQFLEKWVLEAENEDEARKRLNAQLNYTWATAPHYPDKTAVHFAAQIVADSHYGGESGNEVFFLYPSDVLASQHNYSFNGWGKDFTQPQDEKGWNDVFVWPLTLDNPGIPVDSGIVFLPRNTPVDPETGSKYVSEMKIVEGEEKRVMVEDEKLIAAFVEWAENLNDESPAIQALKGYEKKRNGRWVSESDCFDAFRKEIMKLGFSEEAAIDVVQQLFSSVNGINQFQYDGTIGFGDTKKDAALKQLRSASANWERAKNTVSSKEYWERYFAKHSQQKPKHVIFYDGDPTSAIYEFQQRNNIGRADVSKTEGKLLGFDDHHVADMDKDPRANAGYDELVKTAHKIIEHHYKR